MLNKRIIIRIFILIISGILVLSVAGILLLSKYPALFSYWDVISNQSSKLYSGALYGSVAQNQVPFFRKPVLGEGEGVRASVHPNVDWHTGVDEFAIDYSYPQNGMDVYPTLPGRVVFSGCVPNYGCTVVIRHWDYSKWDKIYYSLYAHMNKNTLNRLIDEKKIRQGDLVDGNSPIGQMDNEGTGSVHLHFVVRTSDQAYDDVIALYGKIGTNPVMNSYNVYPNLH